MRLSVIGCGYLGVTHAACMASIGHEVVAFDIDARKIDTLTEGDVPFYEPGLEDLLRQALAAGRLRFERRLAEVAEGADVHFVCVGTPQVVGGMAADVSSVTKAVHDLASLLTRPALVVGKSTVPVGTAETLRQSLQQRAPIGAGASLAWNPEFLREGWAIKDTLEPERLVFGVRQPADEDTLRKVYAPILEQRSTPVVVTGLETAELVKTAANAFLATKISFINAMADVCEASGADITDLALALGQDSRIGHRFLQAGLGFGGGCLPKDIRGFVHRAGELGVAEAVNFLHEVDRINERRRRLVVERSLKMLKGAPRGRVAVLGAAFKPNSDDIRDSPALWVAGQLQLAGQQVTVYDPRAVDNARELYPTLDYAPSAKEACMGADLVLHLTEWEEFRDLTPEELTPVVARPFMFDARNSFPPQVWRGAGWTFESLGRR